MMMKTCVALAASAVALFATTAQATPFGETFTPAKFTLSESATGVVSGTYNGNPVGTVLVLSGASASSKTLGAHILSDLCDTNVAVMWDSASGSNYRAYACDTKASNVLTGTADSLVVIKRDTGGSKQGVDPIQAPSRISFMRVGAYSTAFAGATSQTNNCVATGNAPSLNSPSFICGTADAALYPDAGLSDVEPAIVLSGVNGGSNLAAVGTVTSKAIFQQLIGVAVNTKLYRALQATQGLTQNDDPANRPSLPSAFITSAVTGKLSPGGKRGWQLVVSPTVDPAVATRQVNICRRTAGSGTQAAAQIQFGGQPCAGEAIAHKGSTGSSPAIAAIGTGTAVAEGSSTGAVEGCLGAADALATTAYAIGHVGRDNDPLSPADKGYRFVKIDGAQPEAHPDATSGRCDGTRAFAGCDDAQNGRYNYVYESTMQWNDTTPGNAAKATILNNLATKGFSAAQLAGNSAAIVAGVMALPTSYTGLYENLALGSANQVYGSRITRGGKSCAPATLQK